MRYTTETFGPVFSELVQAELDTRFSRRTVEIAPTEGALPFGLVLACDSSGQYVPFKVASQVSTQNAEAAPPASDTVTACAILISPCEASETAQKALIIGGYALINPERLVWDASVTDKKPALAALEARGFVMGAVEVEDVSE